MGCWVARVVRNIKGKLTYIDFKNQARLLLEFGACPTLRFDGIDALTLARDDGDPKMVGLLRHALVAWAKRRRAGACSKTSLRVRTVKRRAHAHRETPHSALRSSVPSFTTSLQIPRTKARVMNRLLGE